MISIVVPVLNEAENVSAMIKRVGKATSRQRVEILFVDDSKDLVTVEAVKQVKLARRHKNLNLRIYHRSGRAKWGGLSGAVVDGISRAKGAQVIVMDGDLQHPPEALPELIAAAASSDVVVASRYCQGGSAEGLSGRLRQLASRGSTLLAKLWFARRLRGLSDPLSGYFLIDRRRLDISRLRPKGFKILLEILATHPKLIVSEIPINFSRRQSGQSHASLKPALQFASQLVSLRLRRMLLMFLRWPKIIRFCIIGGLVFAVGLTTLYALVELLGLPPLTANALQLALTFWLNYALNRNLTWGQRTLRPLATHKFLVSRAATTALNYLIFVWLVSFSFNFILFGQTFNFTVHYLAANIVALIAITALNYRISDRWVFAEQSQVAKDLAKHRLNSKTYAYLLACLFLTTVASGLYFNPVLTLGVILSIIGLALFIQSSIEVWRTLYAFRQPESIDRLLFPKPRPVREHFCLIVPARHEAAVLAETLTQLARQSHPNVEIITVICEDDHETLQVAASVAAKTPRLTLLTYPLAHGEKPSKPKQLNYALKKLEPERYTVVGVVDAEDDVHPELLRYVDTAFRKRQTGIVQGGVQLMNYDSSWYSLHNVLEYYRWYQSSMAFQASNDFMPLGGNTVFIREKLLRKVGGWPETLTEDCSLGVLLSTRYRAKTVVYYEPWLATREETPDSLRGLFKQRVRWHQGFFHEWRKGVWHDLPTFKQRLLADYVLIGPVLLAIVSIFLPLSVLTFVYLDAPVGLVMLMYLPLATAALLVIINALFLYDFGQAYKRKIKLRHYAVLLVTQAAYQLVLNAAALWAVLRELRGEQSWYKTPHTGKHRTELAYATATAADTTLIEAGQND